MNLGQRIRAYILNVLYWVGFDNYVDSVIASAPTFDPNEDVDNLTAEQIARIDAKIASLGS